MDHRDTFKPLNDAIIGHSPELSEIFHHRYAQWYDHALSDLALLTDGAEVQLADVVVTGDDPDKAYSARIVIFTEHLIITVTADVNGDVEHHATSARGRADLRTIEVAAETGLLGNTWPTDWPGKVRVKLDYGDSERLMLPGSNRARADQHEQVVALLPSLRADLIRATA